MGLTKLQLWLLSISAVLLALTILVCSAYVQKESTPAEDVKAGNITSGRSDEFKTMLMPISDVSDSDVLIDISENSTKHINGSVALPYTNFTLDAGLLKPASEIAQILGSAGVSDKDKIVIYGECMPCGGGPAPATYVYWILKCLGHENVWVLDGNVEDWAAAGLPTANESMIRHRTNYAVNFTTDFIANYEYVKSGGAQIVDARHRDEFEAGTIPGAINIPYDNVLDNHTIKNETDLKDIFMNLSKDQTVVVFTDTGIKASVVWFSLKLMGYDAKLYSWMNWLANQPPEGNTTNSSNITNGNVSAL